MTDMTHPYTDLKEAAEKATPGPWFNDAGVIWYDSREPVCCGRSYQECCGDPVIKGGQEQIGGASENDAAFIAIANPARILSLIEENERMREALAPFAKAGELFSEWHEGAIPMLIYEPVKGSDYRISSTDLLFARAALKEKPHD